LFDRSTVERTKFVVAPSGRSHCICASGPVSPQKPGSESENDVSVGRRNWPHLHCTGCLLHRDRTAKRARLHFMGGQLDLRRQPDSFRSTANSVCPCLHFLSEIRAREDLLSRAAGIFRILGRRIVVAHASSLGDRRFCSGTYSRNTVVPSETGIPGCQEPRLVRDEARTGIWNSACRCFHLFVRGYLHCSRHSKGRHTSIPVIPPRPVTKVIGMAWLLRYLRNIERGHEK